MRHASSPSGRHGFTLVELLVVIGIIALLISILLPALNKARESANAVACMSAQRQNAMAVSMYAQESKGFLPPYRLTPGGGNAFVSEPYWMQYLPHLYLKNGYGTQECKSDIFARDTGAARPTYARMDDGRTFTNSFALNGRLPKRNLPYYGSAYSNISYNPSTLRKVRAPSQLAIFLETKSDALLYHSTAKERFRFDHRKGTVMTIAFADGHADVVTRDLVLASAPTTYTTWPAGYREFWFGRNDITSHSQVLE